MANPNDDTSYLSTSNKSVKFCFLDDQDKDMGNVVGKSELVLKSMDDGDTNINDKSCNKSCDTIHEGKINSNGTNIGLDTQLTFLIEIAGITLPPNKSSAHKWMMDLGDTSTLNPRGMHCTATWINKPKTAADAPREETIHRTKTMRVVGGKEVADPDLTVSTSESSDDTTVSAEEEGRNSEHILTVDDSSLFLFDTTMKQLLHAQTHSSDEDNQSAQDQFLKKVKSCGGLRFDIFEKPIDALSSIYRSVLAESTREKEDNATDASFSYSSKKLLANYNASYRLIGSVFLTPEEIVSRCDEERFECNLCSGLRKEQRNQKTLDRRSTFENGGKLALRIRKASEFDKVFIRTLRYCDVNNIQMTIDMLNNAVRENDPSRPPLEPVTITTEIDEKEVGVQASLKALGDLSPQAFESVRYLFSDDTQPRVFVKPYPDPDRMEETKWFTEEELHDECWKDSTNWIKAGSGSLGKVYVEVLQCRDLPNVDTGPGNKTDAFVSIVYGDCQVQTEVINDSLAPMWMPWTKQLVHTITKRAFVFNMEHPSKALYIGVIDYDSGPFECTVIRRINCNNSTSLLARMYWTSCRSSKQICPWRLVSQTRYTLSYKLYETSNLTDRGEPAGIITLRLRLEYDEKRYLKEGLTAPATRWVNSQQWKSHRVAKYCVDGPHDEEGQVKVGNAWLPLHSAIVFYFSVCLVERPQLLPSFFCFACGWIMIANMFQQENHPNPWKRGHSFSYYASILMTGKSHHTPSIIEPLQGYKEAIKYEKMWKDRLAEDDARWAKAAELDAKVKNISDESIIRTKAKSNAVADPISSLAGARLLPYQQRLSRYCNKIRYVRNILNWTESIESFRLTLLCFACGAAALIIPWAFILKWSARIVVWTFLGPWMKVADIAIHGSTVEEELQRSKVKSVNELHHAFKIHIQAAKILRENTLKLKAFRVKLFGEYITKLPDYELSRHEDIPLPESSAEPYHGDDNVEAKLFIPGQNIQGAMIPSTTEYNTQSQMTSSSERDLILDQYKVMAANLAIGSPDECLHDDFELVSDEDQIVCLRSPSLVDNDSLESRQSMIKRLSSRTIQTALDQDMQQKTIDVPQQGQQKSRWIFSASIQLSLKQESEREGEMVDGLPLLDADMQEQKLIEDHVANNAIEEEGVEVVPYLECEENESNKDDDNTDHVSVLYLKGSNKTMRDID
eukprot:scaffold36991_cov79-Cyclotella_meneghiniana.AAC.3